MLFSKEIESAYIYEFIHENQDRFYRLAFSYTKNKEDALDVVQEAICKAIQNLHKVKNHSYIKTWFYRILINCAIDRVRNNHRIFYVEYDEQILEEEKEIYELQHLRIDLVEAFENIDEKYRTIIILRFFEDLKIEQIAEVLDCNTNTVKTRLYKALKLLKDEMEGDAYAERFERSKKSLF